MDELYKIHPCRLYSHTDGRNGLEFEYNLLNLFSKARDTSGNASVVNYQWLADGTKVGASNGAGTVALST